MARPTSRWLAIWLMLTGVCLEATTVPTSLQQTRKRAAPHRQGAARPEPAVRSQMWWRGEEAHTAFGIDARCSAELEDIFQQTLPKLKSERADVVRREDALTLLLANASTTNESAVVQAVEDLEAARRSLSRTFTMMTYYMYVRLTPSQRAKVHAYLNHPVEHSPPSAAGQKLL